MSIYVAIGLSLLLAFSYKFTEVLLSPFHKAVKYTVYIWGVLVAVVSLLLPADYVYNPPQNIAVVMRMFIIVLFVGIATSRYSGYSPAGTFNTINFVLVYPVFEEAVFRGMILPILNRNLLSSYLFRILGTYFNAAVLITALLFAISHLQYYKLSSRSIRYMAAAFCGGLFFGGIALATQSILFTIILHIAYNASATYYSRRNAN